MHAPWHQQAGWKWCAGSRGVGCGSKLAAGLMDGFAAAVLQLRQEEGQAMVRQSTTAANRDEEVQFWSGPWWLMLTVCCGRGVRWVSVQG